MLGTLVCGGGCLCGAQQVLPQAPSALLDLREPSPGATSRALTVPGELPANPTSGGTEFWRGETQIYAEDGTPLNPALAALSDPDQGPLRQKSSTPPPCNTRKPLGSPPAGAPVAAQDRTNQPCLEENPVQPIVGSHRLPPLAVEQKGYLAFRDVVDPFNLITVFGYAGIDIASNAHTAYGPGWKGFGRLSGYSLVEDMQGEFVGTFVIPSLAHEDPRYFRMPGRPFARRLLHAVQHTIISQHDDGTPMPNYATLLTYPISAELTNLYVPGVQTDGPSTVKRFSLGLATDPAGQIVAEFLPDLAKRIHIRVIFVQQILQQVAGGGTGGVVASGP